MPSNYNGLAASADFPTPAGIILDGEVWQFGDATSGAGGHFGITKAMLDRIAWLKAHGGFTDTDNMWTGVNTFHGNMVLGNTSTFTINNGSTLSLGGTETVTSTGLIEWNNGAELHAKSGSNVQIDDGVTCTISVDTLKLTNTGNGFTFHAPLLPTGSNAITYARQSAIADAASQHIGTSNDVWRVQSTLGSARTVTVDPPANTGIPVFLRVFRRCDADTHQVTLTQAGGDIGFFNEGGHTTFTEYDGSSTGRGMVCLIWSVSAAQWTIFDVSGAFAPASGAL